MLDKYKLYKTIYKVIIVCPNGSSFIIRARMIRKFKLIDLDLSDSKILDDYRTCLNNKECIILSFYTYQVPSLLTRVINIIELIRNIFIRR